MIGAKIDDTLDQTCFDGFMKLTHELTGITIKPDRQVMLVGRLRRRVHELNLPDFESYLDYVRTQRDEHEMFVNRITTNETYFFRTPRVWEYIETVFLPDWSEKNRGATLHVWSAASSSGEEAHSLGIMLHHFRQYNKGFDYKIQGTDIDTSVLERARNGVYRGRSLERFREARPDWFDRYMKGNENDGYTVLPDIRSRLQFSRFNLFDTPPTTPRFDLVLIRNVLIYFNAHDQEKVMTTVHRRMNQEGVAIIGESETLNNLNTDFESLQPTIYKPIYRAPRQSTNEES